MLGKNFMKDLKFYAFKPEEKGLIKTAIERNCVSQDLRRQKTEQLIKALSKQLPASEVAKFRKMVNELSDDEFWEISKRADSITEMLMPDSMIQK
jgi:hypothetical protein